MSGALRRGLESGARLFTLNITRPDARVLILEGKEGKLSHTARGPGTQDDEMAGQGAVSARTDCCCSAEPPAVARTEGGDCG